jgi:hypothetical protein
LKSSLKTASALAATAMISLTLYFPFCNIHHAAKPGDAFYRNLVKHFNRLKSSLRFMIVII